jgi:hypothetical protein
MLHYRKRGCFAFGLNATLADEPLFLLFAGREEFRYSGDSQALTYQNQGTDAWHGRETKARRESLGLKRKGASENTVRLKCQYITYRPKTELINEIGRIIV